jgi:hypothetical protein
VHFKLQIRSTNLLICHNCNIHIFYGGDFLLKIFATQLSGVFNSIQDKQIYNIEDGARLLSQSIVSGGSIYLYGTDEMSAITSEAINGIEPLSHAVALNKAETLNSISEIDRVLIVTRSSTNQEALTIAKGLNEKGIPFVSISATTENDEESIVDLADVHIDLPLKKGLVPTEDGSRIGLPFSMAALYVYYGLKFTIDEILKELDTDLE